MFLSCQSDDLRESVQELHIGSGIVVEVDNGKEFKSQNDTFEGTLEDNEFIVLIETAGFVGDCESICEQVGSTMGAGTLVD